MEYKDEQILSIEQYETIAKAYCNALKKPLNAQKHIEPLFSPHAPKTRIAPGQCQKSQRFCLKTILHCFAPVFILSVY